MLVIVKYSEGMPPGRCVIGKNILPSQATTTAVGIIVIKQ